jgi:hypothetical protein
MASKIIVDQLQTTSLALNALTLPASNATANQYLQDNGSGVLSWSTVNSPAFASYAVIADRKTADTTGGTFTAGAWQTRDLQTEICDADSIVSISANAFTLAAGSYLIKWRCPCVNVDRHQTRLYDVTGTAVVMSGDSGRAGIIQAGYPANYNQSHTYSNGAARITPAASNVYRIEHYCTTTISSHGFGIAANLGEIETYTTVEIYKEA